MFSSHKPKELTPAATHAALVANEITLIDVREPAETAAARIGGALQFPLSAFDPKALPDPGGRPIVFHCGSGVRSAKAVELCRKAGLNIDTHMAGGITAWKRDGLPIVTQDAPAGAAR
jgi:rhodanese-related sulfurtransferase